MNLQKPGRESLFSLQSKLSNLNHRAVGALGEDVAYTLLERAGYAVSYTRIGQRRGDLRAVDKHGEVFRVEVKTARRGRDGKYRFTLIKKGCTDYRDADVVILLAVCKSGRCVPFVIPVTHIGSRSAIAITSHPDTYKGTWSHYRQPRKLELRA